MSADGKIPFLLVTGFLGSGKTTFIKRLLDRYADGKRIGVVQNEYASANIDTEELRTTGKKFDVLEMNNGSVFCICLLANFIDSLSDFIDQYYPEILILEASGLSDPIAIAELLQHEKLRDRIYLHHTLCIIDAQNYFKVNKLANRLRRQIQIADILVINKIDLGKSLLSEIRAELKHMNAIADIKETSYCAIEVEENWFDLPLETIALKRRNEHRNIEPSGRAEINTVVLKTTFRITESQLVAFITEVEKKLIRMKGYVNLLNNGTVGIQSEFGRTKTAKVYHYSGPTEMIGLGYCITSAEFGRRFHEIRKVGYGKSTSL